MSAAPGSPQAATLAGRRIVVTRPAGQADALAGMIEARGGRAIVFPVIEIRDVEDVRPLLAVVDRLETYDLAVFISPNAVAKAMNLILARRAWPQGLVAAAVGRESERALVRHGVGRTVAPRERFDSEALLALPELADVAGKRVVIFRGDGGRELLGDTLTARGATVEYAECYRRTRPVADVAPLLTAWARGEIDAVTVTSSEGLANLFDMVGKLGQQWLRRTPLFAPHERIAANARALGLERVVLTGPADAGLVAGLEAFFAKLP
ncbi:MAG: uroporphyrinogen-III synthase [Burkholderiales bacterium]|nr:uroporphyrinogen-III synthase [Burkholderiales bacterium]